jgi:hypothetical protein
LRRSSQKPRRGSRKDAPKIAVGETGCRKPPEPEPLKLARFYAESVMLDPDRPSLDMGRVAEEVLSHLSTLPAYHLDGDAGIGACGASCRSCSSSRVTFPNCAL